MNPNGVQPSSGWQGMGLGATTANPTDQSIMNGQSSMPVDPSPQATVQPAGSPNTGALASMAMLAMMA